MNGEPMNGDPAKGEPRPALRIVRGVPTDEELAALTVVLAAAAVRSGATAEPSGNLSWWNDPESRLRRSLDPGPGAWRASARPH